MCERWSKSICRPNIAPNSPGARSPAADTPNTSLKCSANISRRNFLNIGISGPQDPERALGVLGSRPENDFDFTDVVGSAVDHRVADC